MVLLTSSAISVAISSGIVFLFTFLLFLSGYVLQQQTVRSLQEALQSPVEVRIRLPNGYQREFEGAEDVLLAVAEGNNAVIEEPRPLENSVKPTDQIVEIILGETIQPDPQPPGDTQELTPKQLWHAQLDGLPIQQPQTNSQIPITINSPPPPQLPLTDPFQPLRIAYVLSLPSPADLCSALLFTKYHRQSSPNPSSQFNIIYLYPSNWETTSNNPVYQDALRLLIESEHRYSVLLHPVQISKIWTGIDVESQLLSELARNPWAYDRVMYLRSPGILVDAARLDDVVVESYVRPEVVKNEWTKLRAPVGRGAATSLLRPDVLLFAQGRGLMVPVGGAGRGVTARAATGRREEIDDRLAREAAYVLFEEGELVEKGKEKERIGRDDLLGRFERERQAVCEGTLLLS